MPDLEKVIAAQRGRLAELLLRRDDLADETVRNDAEVARLKSLISHNAEMLRASQVFASPE
jgi:hypothetical protein